MTSTYWIEESLAGIVPTLWMFLGVGLPWAYAVLSRRFWPSTALIGATALALGPAWMTAWTLLLGVAGAQLEARLLQPEWVLLGSVVIAAAGGLIAWRKRDESAPRASSAPPLAFDEKLIIALIAVAVALRWIHTAFWPFTAYDALWVFAYQGRHFFLEGNIPTAIDYYPPFLSLQFTYVQTLIGGINDHAARMVLPMLHIGSILAAYLLGERLLNRRVGLILAALWSLHPQVGRWAVIGDLEIPLTFSFTLAAVFYLRAWSDDQDPGARQHEALLAGLMLGIALFTKPTAGAFLWGVLLLLAVDLLLKRFQLRRWRPRLSVALWTGLACVPLGALWYLRNLALAHEVVTLPKAVWLTRALRNGDYLAPLLIAAVFAWLALAIRFRLNRREAMLGAVGMLLLLAGTLASNPKLFPERVDPPASYIELTEAALMAAGLALGAFSLRRAYGAMPDRPVKRMVGAGGWALLLALPYFVTFFYSYSYHYRLGFAILPLLCLPIAIALSMLLSGERISGWSRRRRRGYYLALFCASLPGIAAPAMDVSWSSLWLGDDRLDSDIRKYQVFNPSLLEVVFGLEDFARATGKAPIVLAPGEERLPFFFPQMRIMDQPVASLAEFESLGATHFIYGAKAREAYLDAGLDLQATQLLSALGRVDLFQKTKEHRDATFSYELYEALDWNDRWTVPKRHRSQPPERPVVIYGGRLQVYVDGMYPAIIHRETPITFEPSWRALRTLEREYQFVLQLWHPEEGKLTQEWRLRPGEHRHGYYSPKFWEVNEVIRDRHILRLDPEAGYRRGDPYIFLLGVWDPVAEGYLSLEVDGEPAGEFFPVEGAKQLPP
ncbi:MAG: glycosyltransferase family 39 protein [Chloroflexi bacterium]|nr:glycosyltransferase family 39 protein [Chloroflexota bacterium]